MWSRSEASRSLFVYAAAVTPVVVPAVGGVFSVPSTIVAAPSGVDVVAEVLAGVADDPEPVGGRVEVDAEVGSVQVHGQLADLADRTAGARDDVDTALVADAVQLAVLHPEVDADQLGVAGQAGDRADRPRCAGGVEVEADQPAGVGEAERAVAGADRGGGCRGGAGREDGPGGQGEGGGSGEDCGRAALHRWLLSVVRRSGQVPVVESEYGPGRAPVERRTNFFLRWVFGAVRHRDWSLGGCDCWGRAGVDRSRPPW